MGFPPVQDIAQTKKCAEIEKRVRFTSGYLRVCKAGLINIQNLVRDIKSYALSFKPASNY